MFDRALSTVENVIIVISFAGITFLAFANVVARYVFHASFSFTSEILINIAVLLTMVGASAATRQGGHPSFSMLRDTSTGLRRRIVVLAICAAMLTFYLVFGWLGLNLVESQAASGRLTPALQVPQWTFTVAIPLWAAPGTIRPVPLDGITSDRMISGLCAAAAVTASASLAAVSIDVAPARSAMSETYSASSHSSSMTSTWHMVSGQRVATPMGSCCAA